MYSLSASQWVASAAPRAAVALRGSSIKVAPKCLRPCTGNRRLVIVKASTAEAVEQQKPAVLDRPAYPGRVTESDFRNNARALRQMIHGGSHSSMDWGMGTPLLLNNVFAINGEAMIMSRNGCFVIEIFGSGDLTIYLEDNRVLEHVQVSLGDENGHLTCIVPKTMASICGDFKLPASIQLAQLTAHPNRCMKVLNSGLIEEGQCVTLGDRGHLEWPVNISCPHCATCPMAGKCKAL